VNFLSNLHHSPGGRRGLCERVGIIGFAVATVKSPGSGRKVLCENATFYDRAVLPRWEMGRRVSLCPASDSPLPPRSAIAVFSTFTVMLGPVATLVVSVIVDTTAPVATARNSGRGRKSTFRKMRRSTSISYYCIRTLGTQKGRSSEISYTTMIPTPNQPTPFQCLHCADADTLSPFSYPILTARLPPLLFPQSST